MPAKILDYKEHLRQRCTLSESGCWLWDTKGYAGYGSFWMGGRCERAHRVSYQLHIGRIPFGMVVIQSCKNRLCINPDHLILTKKGLSRIRPDSEWRKVLMQRSREAANGCRVWIGATNAKGYGVMTVAGKRCLASRLAYRLFVGEIAEGLNVLHRCDNPPCIAADHLFLGTIADNSRDMAVKGRGTGKLSPEQVKAIRADPRPQSVIALEYGVIQQTISLIKARKTYRHVA